MKIKKLFLLAFILVLTGCKSVDPQVSATYALIERVTPGYSEQFELELTPSADGVDRFEIGRRNGKVLLKGNNPVSLATAYNQYLKYHCNAHVSWVGNQLNLPDELPLPNVPMKRTIHGKQRVYMNYCTFSYSAPWWNWERWQREIDFMAMNSINMPLAVVGLEAVWYNTLLKYNFTDLEARTFLAGPAHFAWQWMQNLQSYGGPLPMSWIKSHIDLGQKIINRELELGMQPIQQGFSGYVPRELKNKYPEARIKFQPSWCGFKGSAQLDPSDSLFYRMGMDFLNEQKKLFGAHGVYAADPFHESAPPINTPEYLSGVGHIINKLFKDFDPNALWAMQSWSLREPIVKAVDKKDLLILDLNGAKSAKKNPFWGYNAVAGNLHSFGGRINMHGDLGLVASNQYQKARKQSPNITGNGLFMEAINQNPVFYDLAFEMPLYNDGVELNYWLEDYATRRYGAASKNTYEAMKLLLKGPYRPGTNGTEASSIIAARPALNVKKSGPNTGFIIPYAPSLLIKAEGLLLKDAYQLSGSDAYCYDVVDVQRQLMSNLGQYMHKAAVEAFWAKDKAAFKLHSQRFLQLLSDVDRLLRTRDELNLDTWLSQARSWGTTPEEKDLLEKNATSLVTIWGGDIQIRIFDYSWREWSGLINGYYLKRWEMFYKMLSKCLDEGREYSEKGLPQVHGREAFEANDFYKSLAQFELQFVNQTNKVRPHVDEDGVDVAYMFYDQYLPLCKEYMKEDFSNDKKIAGNIFKDMKMPK